MKVLAHAKLNLNLAVGGKREDGFHELNSVMTSISIADCIEVRLKKIPEVTVIMNNCTEIDHDQNTAYTTACKFFESFKRYDIGANIKIQKNIPIMAGLGGSSADAAGVLYCLATLCGVQPNNTQLLKLAAECGSDTLAMLTGGCIWLSGNGNNVEKLPVSLPMTFIVAVGERCSTKKVFEVYDTMPAQEPWYSNKNILRALRTSNMDELKEYMRNDLTEACCVAYPAEREFIKRCTELVGEIPTLTGSGGAVFWTIASEYIAIKIVKKLRKNGITAFLCSPLARGIELL